MFKQIVTSALFAGFAAGLIAAALHFLLLQPLILQAELYETGTLVHFGGAQDVAHDHTAHSHDTAAGTTDLKRNTLTVLFTILQYTGFAFVLLALMTLAIERGITITPRTGLLWGIAGFTAVQLAPSIGLPPELPGSAAAELAARQFWWIATIATTIIALGLIAFGKGWPVWAAAIALLLAPHLIGAPHPQTLTGPVPPELAGLFAARVLGVGMAAWTVMGLTAAHFLQTKPHNA